MNVISIALFVAIFVAGLAAGAAAWWLVARAGNATLRAERDEKERNLARAQGEVEAHHTTIGDLRQTVARLETTLEQERRGEARLTEAFKALSVDALKSSSEVFLKMANETLGKYSEVAKNDLDGKRKDVEQLVKPLKESLDRVNTQIQEIEKVRRQDYGGLSENLKALQSEAALLHSETKNLRDALRTPAVRGRWGEIQLRRVVELAGMIEHCDFVEQPTVVSPDGRLKPDMVVRLPADKYVVVDSKAPLESYLKAQEAGDEDAARALMTEHARLIRSHVAKLSMKSYWDQFENTPEFVVMFLPGENFFSAALAHEPGLIEDSVAQRVIIATPTTLIALLRAVAYGWRQKTIEDSAQAISQLGQDLYHRLCVLADHFKDMGKGLDKAVTAYNESVASLEGRVLVAARRFPELGVSGKKRIPNLSPVEKFARVLQAPELFDPSLTQAVAREKSSETDARDRAVSTGADAGRLDNSQSGTYFDH
jgi:DNA recombination protein RmuC